MQVQVFARYRVRQGTMFVSNSSLKECDGENHLLVQSQRRRQQNHNGI